MENIQEQTMVHVKKRDNARPFFATLSTLLSTVAVTLKALFTNKLGWRAVPILLLLLVIALFLLLSTTIPAIAPFVYTIF